VQTLKQLALRWLPSPEWVLNRIVNRIPLVGPRMAVYRAFGMKQVAPGTGALMLTAEVHYAPRLKLGRGSVVGPHALLDARGGITIGDDVNISGYVRMMTAKHDVQDPDFTAVFAPIVVGDRAWVALGATVLGGVTIGEGAIVAANATVTRDVAPYTIVAGTPAAPVGERTRDLRYELTYRPNWA
jgi:acetyltransferase-like isoleucine patch superfamily enzyme